MYMDNYVFLTHLPFLNIFWILVDVDDDTTIGEGGSDDNKLNSTTAANVDTTGTNTTIAAVIEVPMEGSTTNDAVVLEPDDNGPGILTHYIVLFVSIWGISQIV